MLGKKPLFIKREELPEVIDDDSIDFHQDPEYATFDEWKERKYIVMKGEKSYRKDNGVAVFHRDQTREMSNHDDSVEDLYHWPDHQ